MIQQSKLPKYAELRKDTLAEQVYCYLRNRIVQLDLKPGEKIDVQRISEELGVSQTPVREALHRLTEEGFVEQKPYIGYFVTSLTLQDIEELFEIRKTLECLAIHRLPFNETTHLTINNLLQQLSTIKEYGFPAEYTQSFDTEFHINFLLCGANGRWVTKLARNVIDLIKMTTRMSQNPKAAYEEHQRILFALREENRAQAAETLAEHIERSKRETLLLLSQGKGGDETGKTIDASAKSVQECKEKLSGGELR